MNYSIISTRHADRYFHCSARYRYMYVEVPKVACTSIKVTLFRMEMAPFSPPVPRGVTHKRECTPLLKPRQIIGFEHWIADAFVFAFVRDPFERALSGYLDKIVRGSKQIEGIRAKLAEIGVKKDEISFEDFLLALTQMEPDKIENHFRSQSLQLMTEHVDYDFLGRFENFETDFRSVVERLGCDPAKMIRSSRGHATNAAERKAEFRTPRAVKLVEDLYSTDYEVFGY